MKAQAGEPYDELLPAERLSNAPIDPETAKSIGIAGRAEGEANRGTVRSRLCRATCGWKQPATEAEFEEALRAAEPDTRQSSILDAWATEATSEELFRAWAEGAYTPQSLGQALHRAGLSVSKAARFLNNFEREVDDDRASQAAG